MIPAFPMTVAERMEQFCQRFEVEPVKLRYIRRATDSVVMNEALLNWHNDTGASIDWIAIGNPVPMMVAYRKDHLSNRKLRNALARLDDAEIGGLNFIVKAVVDGHVNKDDAFPMLFDVLKERRAAMVACEG